MQAGSSISIIRRRLIAGGLAVLACTPLCALAEGDDHPHDRAASETPPWLIALPQFVVDDPQNQAAAHEIMQIVSGDLRGSGLFSPIDASGYIGAIMTVGVAPRFPDWRAINAQVLLTGRVSRRHDDMYAVEALLWDVLSEQRMMSERYVVAPADLQRASHLISTDIVERVRNT